MTGRHGSASVDWPSACTPSPPPDDIDERVVVREARARSIGLHGMSHYRIDAATHPPQLAMGFDHLTESAIDRGIATIADLLR
jgi:GntR family transcriptional regulator/MocR family aminotransferase